MIPQDSPKFPIGENNLNVDADAHPGGAEEQERQIAIFVNGTRYTGDPRTIELSDGTVIAIVIGTPPPSIPSGH